MGINTSVVMSAEQRKCLETALKEMIQTNEDNGSGKNKEAYTYVLEQLSSVPTDARYLSLSLFETHKQYECTINALKTAKSAVKSGKVATDLITRIMITVGIKE